MIDKLEPAIALSTSHYNALPDGGDAMNTQGLQPFGIILKPQRFFA